MDLDRTPPAAELEAAEEELAASAAAQETKRKRRWDVTEPVEEKVNRRNSLVVQCITTHLLLSLI